MTKIKICGTTNLADALEISALGVDYIGFIFYAKSPRFINPAKAAEIIKQLKNDIEIVGVFVNESIKKINEIVKLCNLDYVQLHGDEDVSAIRKINAPVIKVFRIKEDFDFSIMDKYNESFAYLFDTHNKNSYGGTGGSFDLLIIKDKTFDKPIFLSGGLNVENVEKAIAEVKPYAVDVCSGVESSHGIKDKGKLREFINKIRNS